MSQILVINANKSKCSEQFRPPQTRACPFFHTQDAPSSVWPSPPCRLGHLWQFSLDGPEGLIGRPCGDSHPSPGGCFISMKCLMHLYPLLLSLLRRGSLRQREHVEDGRIKCGSHLVRDDTAELIYLLMSFPVAQLVKNLPAMQETQAQSLGWEDPLEKGMATQSGILAWRIPWAEEPGGLRFMESQRVGHDWATNAFPLSPSPWWHCCLLAWELSTSGVLVRWDDKFLG